MSVCSRRHGMQDARPHTISASRGGAVRRICTHERERLLFCSEISSVNGDNIEYIVYALRDLRGPDEATAFQ